MIKKFVTSLLCLLLSVSVAMASDPQAAVDRFVKGSGVASGSIAVKVIDLADGKAIAGHNEEKALIPASIMKSVTTAALLEEVGADYRYHTRVYVDGAQNLGILRGNVIVVGACDPSLGSGHEPESSDFIDEIVESLRVMGIHKIEGKIIIDESEFAGSPRPDSWMPADFKQSYGTGSHALNFGDNSSGRNSVENPAAVFESRLKAAMRESQITLEEKELGEGRRVQILDHMSPTVDDIMRSCMMRSDNLFAESMLRTYGKQRGGDGSTPDAAAKESAYWTKKGMPLDGVSIIDGSGLSRSNRVTADFMGAVLTEMSVDANYASFFPLAGQEGTLKKFLAGTPLDSYIALKTGSMKGIQCYAGYKLDDDYVPTHAVVIMMNDITKSRKTAKRAAENMLLEIFEDCDTLLNTKNNG